MRCIRFLALVYGALIVGFPIVVLAMGYRLREGWDLVHKHPSLLVMFSVLPIYAIVMGFASMFLERLHRKRRRRQGLCPRCEYNLTGNTSNTCPECGSPIGSNHDKTV